MYVMHQSSTIIALIGWSGLTQTVAAQGSPDTGPWHMMHGWNTLGFGGMWFGPLWMIVWLVLIIVAVVALVRWVSDSSGGGRQSTRTARDVLDERYARGEIDRDEYMKRKQDISS